MSANSAKAAAARINHGVAGPNLSPTSLPHVNINMHSAVVTPGASVNLEINPSSLARTQSRSKTKPGRTKNTMARSAPKIKLLKLAGISIEIDALPEELPARARLRVTSPAQRGLSGRSEGDRTFRGGPATSVGANPVRPPTNEDRPDTRSGSRRVRFLPAIFGNVWRCRRRAQHNRR